MELLSIAGRYDDLFGHPVTVGLSPFGVLEDHRGRFKTNFPCDGWVWHHGPPARSAVIGDPQSHSPASTGLFSS